MYQQAHRVKGQPAGPVRGKGKAYTPTIDQDEASGEVVTGIILVHFVLHMLYLIPVLLIALFHLSSLVSIIYPVTLYTRVELLALRVGQRRVTRCVQTVPSLFVMRSLS